MRKCILSTIMVAGLTEVITSWWVWTSWPYDTLDLVYPGFFKYELERLLPWAVAITGIVLIQLGILWYRRRKLGPVSHAGN